MVDLDNIVKTREVQKIVDDDAEHCRLFWQCESFDEYRMKCDMLGIEALVTREEFDTLKSKIFSAGAAL